MRNVSDRRLTESSKRGNSRMIDTRNKRTEAQREADLTIISKLLLRENFTQSEIAEKISSERDYTISSSQVMQDVKELYRRWRDAYLDDVDVLKGRELRRIDELESAYWDSYERSLQGAESYKEDVTEFKDTSETDSSDMIGNTDDEDSAPESNGKVERNARSRMKRLVSRKFQNLRDGEVKFLNGIQWCIDKRCEILGLNAPVKAEMTFDWRSEAQRQGIDPGLVFNELVKKFVDNNVVDGEMKELPNGTSQETQAAEPARAL